MKIQINIIHNTYFNYLFWYKYVLKNGWGNEKE